VRACEGEPTRTNAMGTLETLAVVTALYVTAFIARRAERSAR
jgi:hypothetical protein